MSQSRSTTKTPNETWTIRVQLPAGISNPGRYMARVLKHLLRSWRVRCVAVDEPAEVKRLQGIVNGLAARVAAQSELLSRASERNGRTFPPSHTSGIAATAVTSECGPIGESSGASLHG
jgi:hypothetical protein